MKNRFHEFILIGKIIIENALNKHCEDNESRERDSLSITEFYLHYYSLGMKHREASDNNR